MVYFLLATLSPSPFLDRLNILIKMPIIMFNKCALIFQFSLLNKKLILFVYAYNERTSLDGIE